MLPYLFKKSKRFPEIFSPLSRSFPVKGAPFTPGSGEGQQGKNLRFEKSLYLNSQTQRGGNQAEMLLIKGRKGLFHPFGRLQRIPHHFQAPTGFLLFFPSGQTFGIGGASCWAACSTSRKPHNMAKSSRVTQKARKKGRKNSRLVIQSR